MHFWQMARDRIMARVDTLDSPNKTIPNLHIGLPGGIILDL